MPVCPGLAGDNLEDDLAKWRAVAPLNRTHIENFIRANGNYGWQLQSMVLIKNNRWYYPFHAVNVACIVGRPPQVSSRSAVIALRADPVPASA